MAEEWGQRNGKEKMGRGSKPGKPTSTNFLASTLMPSCLLLFLCPHSSATFFILSLRMNTAVPEIPHARDVPSCYPQRAGRIGKGMGGKGIGRKAGRPSKGEWG
jgi:hypothetical protein